MSRSFKPVSGELTKLSELTEPLEGLYLEEQKLTHSSGFVIEKEDEKVILVGGSRLVRAMQKIKCGTFVRITYLGEEESGGENPIQQCLVEKAV